MDLNSDGMPVDAFLGSLFRDDEAFAELVKGGAATPRDFILLFNELSRMTGFTNKRTWTLNDVRKAVREAGNDTKTIIGGAPVTKAFADQVGADGYSADAPGAVKLIKQIIEN